MKYSVFVRDRLSPFRSDQARTKVTLLDIKLLSGLRKEFAKIASSDPSPVSEKKCLVIVDKVGAHKDLFLRALNDSAYQESCISFVEHFLDSSPSMDAADRMIEIVFSDKRYIEAGLTAGNSAVRKLWRRCIHHVLNDHGSQFIHNMIVEAVNAVLRRHRNDQIWQEVVDMVGWAATKGSYAHPSPSQSLVWGCIRTLPDQLQNIKSLVSQGSAKTYWALTLLLDYPPRYEYMYGRFQERPEGLKWTQEDLNKYLVDNYQLLIQLFTSVKQTKSFLPSHLHHYYIFLRHADVQIADRAKAGLRAYLTEQNIPFNDRVEVITDLLFDRKQLPLPGEYYDEILSTLIGRFGISPEPVLRSWKTVNPPKGEPGMAYEACVKANLLRMFELEKYQSRTVQKLYKSSKITHFGRYSIPLLQDVLKNERKRFKKYWFIINARYDWNGSLYREGVYDLVRKQVGKDAVVRVFEYENPLWIDRIFTIMRKRYPKERLIPFGLIGGHSGGESIATAMFRSFAIKDLRPEHKEKIKKRFMQNGVLVLMACSSGDEVAGLARSLSSELGIDTLGPVSPASFHDIVFGPDKSVISAVYQSDNKPVAAIRYRDGKKISEFAIDPLQKLGLVSTL